MVEYGLILGLIAVLVVTIFVVFEGMTDIGSDGGGTLSDESMGKYSASISAGMY